jgi:hypothetical protein
MSKSTIDTRKPELRTHDDNDKPKNPLPSSPGSYISSDDRTFAICQCQKASEKTEGDAHLVQDPSGVISIER